MTNPYTPPSADLTNQPSALKCIYSPLQAATGAALGGPAGLVYFLRSNFIALENKKAGYICIAAGLCLALLLALVVPTLPNGSPGILLTLMYFFGAWYVASNFQKVERRSVSLEKFRFHSNWKVVGMGLLCYLISVIVIVGPLFVLDLLESA